MITCLHCLICERAIVNAQTNNVSHIELVEEVMTPVFPGLIPQMAFVCVLKRGDGDAVSIGIRATVSLGETVLMEQRMQVVFGEKSRARIIFAVAGLLVPSAGELRFAVHGDERLLGEASILVKAMALNAPPESGVKASVH